MTPTRTASVLDAETARPPRAGRRGEEPSVGVQLPRAAIVAALAGAQHGVVAHRQLRDRGFSTSAIGRGVRAGRLHRLHRGVYAVGHVTVTPKGRLMAAILATGDGSLISHATAAQLHGLREWGGSTIHVTARGEPPNRRGVTGHRTRVLLPGDAARVDGIPVTSVARTLADCGATAPFGILERLWRRADQLQVLDVAACLRQLRSGRPGVGALRRLIAAAEDVLMTSVTRSELEILFLEIVRVSGLPWPETNVRVPLAGTTYEVDALWRDRRLAVELDGWETHGDRHSFEEDRVRDSNLVAAGFRPLRFTWRRVVGDPGGVTSTLRAALER